MNIASSRLEIVCTFQMNNFNECKKKSNKPNYYHQSIQEIEKIKKTGTRPKLLLHACCAPCAAFPIEFLNDVFDCTILYNNSNIYPNEEYLRRFNELKNYILLVNKDAIHPIILIEMPYDNASYTKKLEPLKDSREGSERCLLCYSLRMNEAYQYATENGFDYFTTVMTISRQKDSHKINEIGSTLQLQYPSVHYFHSDFKKNKGINRSRDISIVQHMYRQQYCGCIYSYQTYLKRKV